MPTYIHTDVVFVKGEGVAIWDVEGNEYLDFFPGWAVSGLGHCHKKVVEAIRRQAGRILHVSNNYYSELQADLAELIVKHSFKGKCFFGNSGAEANECAIKLARKYGSKSGRYEIITMDKSFHGRTIATLTATGQKKVKDGFYPLLDGFKTVPFNDIEAIQEAMTDKTVAILLEPIQGEGGINVADASYMKEMRRICDKHDMLLILDEIQTGMGRTGEMFCYKHYGIEPDIMTLAKSLGGGVPIGAAIAAQRVSDTLTPSSHASTFGGSPLVCAAAIATFEAIEEENLLENARNVGLYLEKELQKLQREFTIIAKIKGMGLMRGIELSVDGAKVFQECFKRKLLINCTQGNILRIMPPLTVCDRDIDRAVGILKEALQSVQ